MATHDEADRALAFHQEALLENQNLTFLSVVARMDEQGRPTKEFYIEAGVIRMDVQKAAESAIKSKSKAKEEYIPSRLAIPSKQDPTALTKKFVDIEVVETGEVKALSFTDRRRPCEGGNSVGNPRYNNAGTLGAPMTIEGDSENLYFLSNWHVLVGGSGRRGDDLVQPGRLDGGRKPRDKIGVLYWYALNASLDAAVGKADRPSLLQMGTRCFGQITGLGNAALNQAVKKCGRTSRATTGTVRSINATVQVSGYPTGTRTFTRQIQTTFMLSSGDSGSLLIASSNNRVVGLGFAGDNSNSFHNHISSISSATSKIGQANLVGGGVEDLPTFEIAKFSAG